MAIHKFSLDDFFDDEAFTLIGIHCAIEDYRLAYLLNQALDISLNRKQKDIDYINEETVYSIFEWENESQFTTWHLVANSCKVESNQLQPSLDSLFGETQLKTKVHHLVPEFKKVNYLLKIENELSSAQEKHILNRILGIQQVVTAYSIAANNLKSKQNLIFN